MATSYLAPAFNQAFPEAPLGYLHSYDSGTTTPKAVYQDQAGNTAHALPTAGVPASGIVLDAYGRPPGGFVLGAAGEYTFHLYSAAGTLIKTWNDVGGSGADVLTGWATRTTTRKALRWSASTSRTRTCANSSSRPMAEPAARSRRA